MVLAIVYRCRHCGGTIGKLDQQYVEAETLGLHTLSSEERNEMVSYQTNGDIEVNAICEHCEEALNQNPVYHEMDTFLH
jgi:hypothetical protein